MLVWVIGAVAQLGERRNRTAEVVSSNLIGSTSLRRLRGYGSAGQLSGTIFWKNHFCAAAKAAAPERSEGGLYDLRLHS